MAAPDGHQGHPQALPKRGLNQGFAHQRRSGQDAPLPETIPNLIRVSVHRYNQLFNKNINTLSKSAEAVLANYDYPGNVRELENIIEHAVALADGSEITEKDLPEFMFRNRLLLTAPQKPASSTPPSEIIATLADMEKSHIAHVLALTDHNYTEASKKLGISRSTLWRKVKDYHLENR